MSQHGGALWSFGTGPGVVFIVLIALLVLTITVLLPGLFYFYYNDLSDEGDTPQGTGGRPGVVYSQRDVDGGGFDDDANESDFDF